MPRETRNDSGARGGPKKTSLVREGYSTREAARLCDLSVRQVRALARAGVVGPHPRGPGHAGRGARRLRLVFADLPVLRTVRRLLAAGLSLSRVGQTLRALRAQLGRHHLPLSAVRCAAQAGEVVVFEGDAQKKTRGGGQAVGPCVVAGAESCAAQVVALPLPVPPLPRPRTAQVVPALGEEGLFGPAYAFERADHYFARGRRAERDDPRRACRHYLRAIACDPEHVEAMINLGHVCAAEGDRRRATSFFRLAARVDPGHAVAQYNLAVMLHDAGERNSAMRAYRQALVLDPEFADAHYNLGTLLAEQGRKAEAGAHFSAFHAASHRLPPPRAR